MKELQDLGIVVGSEVEDEACGSLCQWVGWNFEHKHC